MQQQTVTLTDPDIGEVTLTIRRLDMRGYLRLTALESEAAKVKDGDADLHTVRTDVLPELLACIVSAEGLSWPLTPEAALELPAEFLLRCRLAVWEVNPFLRPSWTPPAEKKDELGSSTPG